MKIPDEILDKIKEYPEVYKSLKSYLNEDEDILSLLFELNSYIKTTFDVHRNHILFTLNTLSFAERFNINPKLDRNADDLYKYLNIIDNTAKEYDKCMLQLTETIKHSYTKLDVVDLIDGLLCTVTCLFSSTNNKHLVDCALVLSKKILNNAE